MPSPFSVLPSALRPSRVLRRARGRLLQTAGLDAGSASAHKPAEQDALLPNDQALFLRALVSLGGVALTGARDEARRCRAKSGRRSPFRSRRDPFHDSQQDPFEGT